MLFDVNFGLDVVALSRHLLSVNNTAKYDVINRRRLGRVYCVATMGNFDSKVFASCTEIIGNGKHFFRTSCREHAIDVFTVGVIAVNGREC